MKTGKSLCGRFNIGLAVLYLMLKVGQQLATNSLDFASIQHFEKLKN